MTAVRRLIAQRHCAALICVAALLLKLLVPTGYMVEADHGRISIAICSGTQPRTVTLAMPGMAGHADHGKSQDHAKAEMPCAFAGLSAAALGAVDPVQLAAPIAFALALGVSFVLLPPPSRPARLRPPLRGPPAYR